MSRLNGSPGHGTKTNWPDWRNSRAPQTDDSNPNRLTEGYGSGARVVSRLRQRGEHLDACLRPSLFGTIVLRPRRLVTVTESNQAVPSTATSCSPRGAIGAIVDPGNHPWHPRTSCATAVARNCLIDPLSTQSLGSYAGPWRTHRDMQLIVSNKPNRLARQLRRHPTPLACTTTAPSPNGGIGCGTIAPPPWRGSI